MKLLNDIAHDCGLQVTGCNAVSGGDINETYAVTTTAGKYFLKLNDAGRFPGMFAAEAKGLTTLRSNTGLSVPPPVRFGEVGDKQYLLMEWLDNGTPSRYFWEHFAEGLAAMHQNPGPAFGFEQDNYIGSLLQRNAFCDSWAEFYETRRIMPLVAKLHDNGSFGSSTLRCAENLCTKLSEIFPSEPSALLHGDLWSGNFLATASGYAAIFDPAVYYGHREMDIGMSLLFGGFDRRFYEAYTHNYSLEPGWRQRLDLTQLYPLLVHAVIFGGHYIQSSKAIVEKYK